MLFSSTKFLYLFLPAVLFFYFVVFRKSRCLQNIFLLFASLFFYACGEPKFVLVMIVSIIANWFLGLMIDKKRDNKKLRKFFLCLDIIFNLAILFIFKYLMFAGNVIEIISGTDLSVPEIALPIGISFFTFQAMSYVIDVYKCKNEVQKNILYVGLYISFFPQLIAGPIVRYETIADQIINRKETFNDVADGFVRFIVGLSKKVLLANSFSMIANQSFDTVNNGDSISVLFGWLGAIAYTLQIFFDFSGYSDMAFGLGRMFGFRFPENFDYPYISSSITEFWRRWHISLGTWFRDYLYFPLGGSRCSKARNILNLFIVWFLTGLWHGADFTFIVWGLMYFVLLVIEKLTVIHKKENKILNIFKRLYTMFFVLLGWVIFRAETMTDAVYYIGHMFGLTGNEFTDDIFTSWLMQNIILLVIGIILCTPLFKYLGQKSGKSDFAGIIKTIVLICLFILSVSGIVSSSHNPFIYFNF